MLSQSHAALDVHLLFNLNAVSKETPDGIIIDSGYIDEKLVLQAAIKVLGLP